MKKITLLLTFLVAFGYSTYAQVSGYTFTQNSGTYTENSAGATAVAGALADSYMSDALPIGFTFNYDGNAYTQFKMSSNGVISFNMTGTSNLTLNDLSSANATSRPIIAPLWDDLDGRATGGSFANYEVTGIVGNRVLTVEWRNWEWNYNSSTAAISFQVKLYETTNVIEFVYRQEAGAVTSGTATIGIGSAMGSGAGSYLNVTNVATPAVSSSTSTTNINTKPATGQIYRFAPPSCVAPGGFAASAITTSSATISWNAGSPVPATGYEYYYSSTNTAPTVAGTATTALTANLTGLSSATTYYVWLRSDCGSSDLSSWNGPFIFNTNCETVTDFAQGFEATTGSIMPLCWTKVGTGGSVYPQSNATLSGARNLYMYTTSASSVAVASMIPVSNANAGTHRMVMRVKANVTVGEKIELGYLSNPSDATTFVAINSITTNSTSVSQTFVTIPSGLPAGDVVFGIRAAGVVFASVFIDDVTWEPVPTVAPTCSTITSPADGATNLMSSKVSWTTSVDATGYKLSVGTAPGGTDVLNLFDVGSVTSYTIPTEPGTDYFVTVYPFNVYGTATGCSEISFTTCDALVPEFLEPFDTFLPSCWSNMQGGDLLTGPTASTGSRWVADGFANAGTTGAIRAEIWTTGANSWVISPVVSIPAAGYELKFDAAATQYSSTNAPTTAWEADDFIQVLVTTDGIEDWTVLHTYDNTNQPSNTGTALVINLDAHAGEDVRFAFRAVEGGANGSADIDFFIDNFEVRLTPSTVPVCATNIVATPDAACGNKPTVITWDAVAGADGYNISIGTSAGATDVADNLDIGNNQTYSFVGMVGTTYYYSIAPFNAAGTAVGCAENTFTTVVTGCYCDSVPTSNDNSGITNVQIGTTNFPTTDVTYFNHTATVVDMLQGLSNNVQVTFATGYTYNTNIWIDLNDDYNFDASELVYSGESLGTNPTTLNASFVMPASAPLGQHRMRIGTADSGQATPNPCYSGGFGVTLDFMINVVAPSCVPPVATTAIVTDCANFQYSVAVDVTSLGSGTPSITDGTTTWPVTAIGVVNVGPFANGASVTLTLNHGSDAICNVPLGVFKYSCPPVNDECSGAIALTVKSAVSP